MPFRIDVPLGLLEHLIDKLYDFIYYLTDL
jgi:hypothetical protein